jgi:hypothetical protein
MDKVAEALHDGNRLTDKDQKQLVMKDEEYRLQTWEDLRQIIGITVTSKYLPKLTPRSQRKTASKISDESRLTLNATSPGLNELSTSTGLSRLSC